mmetsp:Transcript_11754/g.42939  ORF Transcript_11754/g.42939 Transcript_11754/m.42939 type:complete len:645 (-) Transcript_11754:3333-5267(-)
MSNSNMHVSSPSSGSDATMENQWLNLTALGGNVGLAVSQEPGHSAQTPVGSAGAVPATHRRTSSEPHHVPLGTFGMDSFGGVPQGNFMAKSSSKQGPMQRSASSSMMGLTLDKNSKQQPQPPQEQAQLSQTLQQQQSPPPSQEQWHPGNPYHSQTSTTTSGVGMGVDMYHQQAPPAGVAMTGPTKWQASHSPTPNALAMMGGEEHRGGSSTGERPGSKPVVKQEGAVDWMHSNNATGPAAMGMPGMCVGGPAPPMMQKSGATGVGKSQAAKGAGGSQSKRPRGAHHRRSASDSFATLGGRSWEDAAYSEGRSDMDTTGLDGGDFEKLDDHQLLSMFMDVDSIEKGLAAGSPGDGTSKGSNPSGRKQSAAPNGDELVGDNDNETDSANPDKLDNETAMLLALASPGLQKADPSLLDPKRAKRILANRQSAQRSRLRKLQYISELEKRVNKMQLDVQHLTSQVAFLQNKAAHLQNENGDMSTRLQSMQGQLQYKDAMYESLREETVRLKAIAVAAGAKVPPLSIDKPPPTRRLVAQLDQRYSTSGPHFQQLAAHQQLHMQAQQLHHKQPMSVQQPPARKQSVQPKQSAQLRHNTQQTATAKGRSMATVAAPDASAVQVKPGMQAGAKSESIEVMDSQTTRPQGQVA